MDNVKNLLRSLASVTLAVLLVGACAGGDDDETSSATSEVRDVEAASEDELQPLIEEAQAEGELTLYTSKFEEQGQALADAFENTYDIDVDFLRLPTAELHQRIEAEAAAGSGVVDVIYSAGVPSLRSEIESGVLVDPAEWDIPGYPFDFPEEYLTDDLGPVVSITPHGIAYNTNEVTEEDLAAGWEAMTDPQWKGRVSMVDPTRGIYFVEWLDLMQKEYGDEWLEGFAANEPVYAEAANPLIQGVSAGEVAMAQATEIAITELVNQGAPLAFYQPEVTTGAESFVAIAADAPHPAAARLFVQFSMSEDGNMVVNDFPGEASPYGGDSLPAGYVSPDPTVEARQEEIIGLLGR